VTSINNYYKNEGCKAGWDDDLRIKSFSWKRVSLIAKI
jgi:hypothetical protein